MRTAFLTEMDFEGKISKWFFNQVSKGSVNIIKPELFGAKKADESKPAAKKTKEVAKPVVEEEEDVDMEEFDDTTVPPPKVGGHKKDLPK